MEMLGFEIMAVLALVVAVVAVWYGQRSDRRLRELRDLYLLLQDRVNHWERKHASETTSEPDSDGVSSVKSAAESVPPPPPPPPAVLSRVPPPVRGPEQIPVSSLRSPQWPESRKEGLEQWEKTLGLRWTIWVGGFILFVGAGLFVKYAFEQRWLGPVPRVILGVLSGLALVVTGERCLRRRMPILGQGLIGVGLAILYASLYGAYALYEILPQPVTFGLMILVTAGAMTLSVWRNAMAISFLALLGGFLTPVLVSAGHDSRDVLFSYLLLLDVGVLTAAFFKQWRGLDVLAFIGTAILFIGWYEGAHRQASFQLWPTFLWQTAFFLLFLAEPFVYQLRHRGMISGERFCLAVTNAFGMFAGSYHLLYPDHRMILGLVTLGMSLVYLALGVLTVPICLDLRAVTIAWAVQGPLLLALAYRYQYLPVRLGSLVPLAL